MHAITIHLPNAIAEELRAQGLSGKKLETFVTATLRQEVLERRKRNKSKQKALRILREAGVVLSSSEQQKFAEAALARLPKQPKPVSRGRVEEALSHFDIPLSQEIINLRGER